LEFKILDLYEWQTPATQYPRTKLGRAAIVSHVLRRGNSYECYQTRPPGQTERYDYVSAKKNLTTTNLKIDGEVWMVDDCPHFWSIQEHAEAYEGDVLVAGLGLGLIVHALRNNPKVRNITVVEREKDVCDLIGPLVPKCQIVCADWYEYISKKGHRQVDGVFFDLFVGKGGDLLMYAFAEMLRLRQQFPGAVHRILGFPNSLLIANAEAVEQLTKEAYKRVLKG
jgi:hypothetical protein